ncbi:hypothetical protein DPMN_110819 [Dreissena polymorpha]|uniref:Uncharacterized protein n=1 Tax=Dreissena polymorpha TaxID=45954 RepID=A0A9D4KDA7_DREPO|nr:hypothetical protein DPMN_110819 [Dreissena polymorpha]
MRANLASYGCSCSSAGLNTCPVSYKNSAFSGPTLRLGLGSGSVRLNGKYLNRDLSPGPMEYRVSAQTWPPNRDPLRRVRMLRLGSKSLTGKVLRLGLKPKDPSVKKGGIRPGFATGNPSLMLLVFTLRFKP